MERRRVPLAFKLPACTRSASNTRMSPAKPESCVERDSSLKSNGGSAWEGRWLPGTIRVAPFSVV